VYLLSQTVLKPDCDRQVTHPATSENMFSHTSEYGLWRFSCQSFNVTSECLYLS